MTTWYGVGVKVEVGFDDGPLVALGSVSWTDITADVRRWDVPMRGRSSELATYSPGTATVILDNRSRTYDPTNTAGAYYGKLLPRRRLRITLTVGAVSAVVFTGYVRGWEQSYPGTTDAVCTVACVDAFDVLSGARLPGSAYGAAVLADSPSHYWPMQEVDLNGGTPALVGGVDGTGPGYSTAQGVTEPATGVLPIGEANGVSNGNGMALEPGAFTLPAAVDFWAVADADASIWPLVNAHDAGSPYTTGFLVQVVQPGDEPYLNLVYTSASDNKRTVATSGFYSVVPMPGISAVGDGVHICATFSPSGVDVYANGAFVTTIATESGTHSITGGSASAVYAWSARAADAGDGILSHVAFYDTAPSAARILAHYEAGTIAHGHPMGEAAGARIGRILDAAGWPSADRDISDGVTVLGPWSPDGGYALTGIRAIEAVEQGLFFISGDGKATFRDRTDQWTTDRMVTAQATFGDDTGETPLANPLRIDGNSIDYVRNMVTVSYAGATVTVKDATSVAAYGEEPDSIDASTLPNTAGWIARQLANYRVRLRKDPATRVQAATIELHENAGADTHVATVAPLELGDRVTVNRRPAGGTGSFSQDCRIEGIRWSWSPQAGFAWDSYLAPVPPSAADGGYFVIGSTLVGGAETTPY